MKTKRDGAKESDGGFEGIMSGIVNLVEKLNELAQTGNELQLLKERATDTGIRGVYGINIKVGLGQDKDRVSVEPFGNIRKDKSGHAVVQEVIEPIVDVFEESDHTLVVAEMPGVSMEDIRLDVQDDMLTIVAEHRPKKYIKEVLLPRPYTRDQMQFGCNNGILEIRCTD
ncbi:Hsp20/alpha crystallin family protein [Burkholderia humptydooensis]|uniref:Hsp20/alpha crystallin family protein n=2 Tax=Burkholderia humptydooensis TaxID=430531 RepID=A0A7U4P928_9BURK|nr:MULTISPECIES: Hsp20/alpha crystallin family protein [Burkholderia]AJY39684.1 hsp20/alpha crystallin family protein [Burkholderia sp. 2002721687]ALX45228.1 heat-shock protein [Burkholderia humptydooensis]QPS46695.1 Hsp20/alpha crystallin family protein [Burkholderia humptydooensis]